MKVSEHSWFLSALWAVAIISWIPGSASAGAYGQSLGEIYLSIDASTREDALIDQPINTPFEFYLLADVDYADLGQPEVNGLNGIWAWETRVNIPESITIINRHLGPGSINVGSGEDNYIVGTPELLVVGLGPTTLVRYEAIIFSVVPDEVLTISPSSPSTFDDDGNLGLGPGWLEWMPLGDCDFTSRRPGSGCLRAFATWDARLVMNCVDEPECVETPTRQESWGTVKSRYATD